MKNGLPAWQALFVIPVHHKHPSVAALDLLQLLPIAMRKFCQHRAFLGFLGVKHRTGILNITHARLYVQLHRVHPAHINIPYPVLQFAVPEYPVNAEAVFEFRPHIAGVTFRKAAPLQNHRDDLGKRFCIRFIPRLPGKAHCRRNIVHHIRVFLKHGVEQPRGGRGKTLPLAVVVCARRHPPAEPAFLLLQPLFYLGSAAAISGKQFARVPHLRHADSVYCSFFHDFSFRFWLCLCSIALR